MMETVNRPSWTEKLSPWMRVALLSVTVILALFLVVIFVGFGIASYEHGHLLPRKPLGWVALGVAIVLSYGLYRTILALLKRPWGAEMSPFDRRYSKMLLLLCALGMPIGIGLSLFSMRGDPRPSLSEIFINAPLSPVGAVTLAVALAVSLTIAIALYHRTIDDHEERAYLWGSQLGYYFLMIALPAYWLLGRGDLVPSLTTGGAMLMLLVSFIVQTTVWAWFKFR